MALISLGRSLTGLIPEFLKIDLTTYKFSTKFLNYLQSLSDNSKISSIKTLKKIVYLCNYQFYKNDSSLLSFAERLLENHFKICRSERKAIQESIYKLYVITLINQSISHQSQDLKKAMSWIIKAVKVTSSIKFTSAEGKSLKFIAKLKEAELCIYTHKFEMGISCAQQVLHEVQSKLQKQKRGSIKILAKLAINAFHKIAVCEEARGMRSSADVALDNAELIREEYLKGDLKEGDVEPDVFKNFKKFIRNGSTARNSFTRKMTEKRMTRLKIPLDPINEHIEKVGFLSDPHRIEPREEPHKRYYSSQRLKALDEILTGKKDVISMNTDKYFYNHIVRALNLNKDIQFSPKFIIDQVKSHVEELTEAKESLKSRRKFFKPAHRDPETVTKKLEKIETEFENHLKVQEVRLKSKLKTRVYQKLIKNINVPTVSCRAPPQQSLHFKQPMLQRQNTMISTPEVVSKSESPKPVFKKDDVKKEIEDQINEIYQDIHGRLSPTSTKVSCESPGNLASSTVRLKKVKSSRIRTRIQKTATNGIFKTEITFN